MSFIARKYGTLVFLAIVGGLTLGVGLAYSGVDLPPVSLARAAATPTAALTTRPPTSSTPSGGQTVNPAPTPQGAQPGTGTGPASGQPFGQIGRGTTGSVQNVEGRTITLKAADGSTAKATVSDSTVYQKTSTITVGDIKVGDTVTAVGQDAGDGSINAQSVTVGAAQMGTVTGAGGGRQVGGMRVATGAVQKVEGNTVTVAAEGGQTIKVTIGPDARLSKTVSASLSDVTAGQQVTIMGQPGADGTIAATMVQIGALR